MPVKDLIAKAKEVGRRTPFSDAVKADLAAVLKSNDAEPLLSRRVGLDKFVAFLREEHKVSVAPDTIRRYCQQVLNRRGWAK